MSGPNVFTLARIGTPSPIPPSEKYSVGEPWAVHVWPMLSVRSRSLGSGAPGVVAMPLRSPLMSAANTGTPAALSCSASTCRVLVLPVPVAPATRPWRLTMAIGMRIWASMIGSPLTRAPISIAGSSKR